MTTSTSATADSLAEPIPAPSLRANRDFQAVLGGQAVSALGDAIALTAMPLLVLFLTGSGALMGIVGALQFLPDLLLGLPAGALADRWDRRRMMMWADAGRALLTAAIPLSLWLGWPTMAVILVVAVPVNALRVLSDAGFSSSVPALVGRENLGRANGYMEATLSVPFIIGPAIAGVLVATIGAAPTMAINAASFAVSAASLMLVRRTLRAERPAQMPHVLADIKQGLAFVWRRLVLRMIIGYWGVLQVATAALIPTLAYYITIDRGLGPELFGFVGSAWSLGYLVGSLAAGRLDARRMGLGMLVGGTAIGAAVVAIALTANPLLFLGASVVIGGALAIVLVSYATLRASVTPDDLLGRVGSTARTVTLGLMPLGLLAGGAVIEATSGAGALLAMGGVAVVASLLFGLSRTIRDAGRPASAV
jgi:MFS family permease